jgi:hypothetical protein
MNRKAELALWVVAIIIITMLALSSIVGSKWYILWALVVAFLWAEAMKDRNPMRYGIPRRRRVFFVAFGLVIVAGVWGLYWVSINLERIAQMLVR